VSEKNTVKLFGDGLSLSPADTVAVLETVLDERGIEAGHYSLGGVVEELENTVAEALGKERGIFFPTGTLANHVAIRALVGDHTRVLVPKESHIYNDSGDCAQQLSQLNLIPMDSQTATFALADVEKVVEQTDSGKVTTGVGAILIESPVRRRLGEMFDYEEMKRICSFARDSGIKTHLDGARLYMASASTGISPAEYASHFDTVYVSLWKYFNAPSGAILAGSREVVAPLHHTRRLFGGGLPGAWPFAAVALYYFDDFEAGFHQAIRTAEGFISRLEQHAAFEVVKIPNGSNLFRVLIEGTDTETFRANLRKRGVMLSPPRPGLEGFVVAVNPTWNRTSAEALAKAFVDSL